MKMYYDANTSYHDWFGLFKVLVVSLGFCGHYNECWQLQLLKPIMKGCASVGGGSGLYLLYLP